jgi:hypothetical protein
VLFDLHTDLDAAVAEAYGWPADLPEPQVLERLVALNAERAAEEERGLVRWLRPSLQAPQAVARAVDGALALEATAPLAASGSTVWAQRVAPRRLPDDEHERLKALRDLFAEAHAPLDLAGVKSAFAFARLDSVKPGVELLESFGVLVGEGEGEARRWRARGT